MMIEAGGGKYFNNKLFVPKADGSPQSRDRVSANFGQLIRHLELPHIRFHDLRHSAATNMHQLTGDFYTVGEILGHTLKGIGMSLGISTNLEAVTAQYVDVRLEPRSRYWKFITRLYINKKIIQKMVVRINRQREKPERKAAKLSVDRYICL